MANNILEMALEQLDFPPSTISAWFDDVTVVSFGDNRLVLHSPVPFKKEFIESKFIAPLQEVLHNLTGDPITIVVVTGEYTAPSTSTSPYDDYTFERFIVGSSNKFAHAAALAVSQRPAAENNPLFIYGNSGLGKTHLMYAIANVLRRTHPEYRIIYVKGEDFTNELITAIQEGNVQAFRNKYRMVDLLLLDDVQFIAGKERTQEEFFHTFNDLYNAGKQIVLTSDIAPSKISKLQNRILTRFSLGVQVDVTPPDFETRMAIVKKKADMLDLQLSDNVVRIIAEKIKTNIRQLEGTVNKIKALTIYTNESPSISMAQRIIKEIIIENHPAEITVDRILQEVAAAFDVTADDIKSTNRRANVSLARKIAIYLFKDVKGMTFIQIGNELNKNHSTMTIHYQDVVKNLKENKQLKDTVDDIIKNLKDN